jgi:hypothetical protein
MSKAVLTTKRHSFVDTIPVTWNVLLAQHDHVSRATQLVTNQLALWTRLRPSPKQTLTEHPKHAVQAIACI